MKKLSFAIAILGLFVTLVSCGQKKETKNEAKLNVIATFYPMYEFTKEVVGDIGNVTCLIPAGVEPHEYEPSAKNLVDLNKADALVYNSQYLEKWVKNVSKTIDKKKTNLIEASSGIPLRIASKDEVEEDEHQEEGQKNYDPHVWLNPEFAIKEVETIRDALSKQFPKEKATFEKNAAAYIVKLQSLNDAYKKAFLNVSQKNIVTQHAAFYYLAKQYGLNQVAISGLSPEEEPSAARLAELKEYVRKNNIKMIYFEETASDKIAKTLAEECGIKLAVLNPLEGLTKEEIKNGDSYISVMQDNLKELQLTVK